MKPIYAHILMLLVSVLLILHGVFQIKRKDTDPVLVACGTMEISCGIIILICAIVLLIGGLI